MNSVAISFDMLFVNGVVVFFVTGCGRALAKMFLARAFGFQLAGCFTFFSGAGKESLTAFPESVCVPSPTATCGI